MCCEASETREEINVYRKNSVCRRRVQRGCNNVCLRGYVAMRMCARQKQKINKYCIQLPVHIISITIMSGVLYYNMLMYHRHTDPDDK